MPRSRGTEMPQRPSPRGPPSLRTSSSDSDPVHYRSRTDRSPKLSDGRSPRTTQSDPVNQKKLGTRIADLESQLGQAQDELKSLKDQLASAEAAKKAAQEQLEKKSKKQQKVPEPVEVQEKHSTAIETKKDGIVDYETADDVQKETDVFEVTIEKVTVEPKTELETPADQDECKAKPVGLPNESVATSQPENASFDELALKNNEINSLKTKLDEKGKELELFHQENENLKSQLNEKSLKISSAVSEIEELKLRLCKVEEELEKSKTGAAHVSEKLEATEKAKEELENEMKKLRVQTEQWRKAADAAASILAGEVEMNGRRISERCGSMDKHYGNSFEPVGGYAGYVGSPGLIDDPDDVFGGGKRKGSGIKMFGDLWRKKGHK
ncbi:Interactor of constitutive active ROPs 4 [Sesamum alatum]|uniref:Interactor of constitutive active ROPs 4 n=1 Tax=Sesamum alatum TaxID=300844 RepID=A0AAE2CFW1_9LAMI|nr:Interactor of constitutive active ROPs 4 [Sesamum alatum]